MQDLSTLAFISEQTSYPEDYKTPFGYTVHDRGNRFYLTFAAILQSFGVLNRNKRMYMAENVMDKINNDPYVVDQLRKNCWCGELDHPSSLYAGQELSMTRIANPDPKISSHFIRSPKLIGNLLEANIQTDSSNENGMNLAIKIVDGKIIPSFSARVLGELKNISGRPTVNIRRLITYDFVLFPSHDVALGKIQQPIQESAGEIIGDNGKVLFFKELAQMAANNSKETEWLCESFGLTIDDVTGVTKTGNSLVIQEGSNRYIQPISDKFIREKTVRTLNNWMNRR